MKIFLNKNTHVGTDEPADKTKTWLPQNLSEEANFLSNPATYGVLSGPRVKIAEGLDAQNIDAYGEKLRAYEVEPSTLVIKEYKNGAWVNMELNLNVPETEDDSIVGTWVFNDSINLDSFPNFIVEFVNNGINYVSMSVYDNDGATSPRHKYFYYHTADTATQVYYSGSDTWYDETYRTIVITSKSTDEAFITWLKANATKQAEATTVLSIYHNTGDGPTYTFNVPSANGTWYSLGGIVSNESPKISLQIPPSYGDISLLDSTSANGKIAFIRLNNSYIDGSANYNVENYYTYSTWVQAGAGN